MDSVAKAEQIRAIGTSRLLGYYGRLGTGQMLQIDEAIRITLALS
jgi:mRNA-degrading endonuclease toxin of MazEF toxin-antitoxin module